MVSLGSQPTSQTKGHVNQSCGQMPSWILARRLPMAPVPESASKAVKLWLQSVENGCELKYMNRVERITHQVSYPKTLVVILTLIHCTDTYENVPAFPAMMNMSQPSQPLYAQAAQAFWRGSEKDLMFAMDFLLRDIPQQRKPSEASLQRSTKFQCILVCTCIYVMDTSMLQMLAPTS